MTSTSVLAATMPASLLKGICFLTFHSNVFVSSYVGYVWFGIITVVRALVLHDRLLAAALPSNDHGQVIHTFSAVASGSVVECRIWNRKVAGSNFSLGYFARRSTQPSIPPGSVNEYQLRLGRQSQVWLIPIADERVGVQVNCEIPWEHMPYLSASAVVIHYEEALCQVYAPLPSEVTTIGAVEISVI